VLSHCTCKVLSHSSLLQCSTIHRSIVLSYFFTATVLSHSSCYNAQSFFIATLLSHFSLLIAQSFLLLQCSTIFHHYSAQPFLMQKELSHSSLLQYSAIFHCKKVLSHSSVLRYSVIFHCYSAQSFLVTTMREAAQSFCKMTELGHGRWRTRSGGHARLDRERAGLSRAWGA
jgi:hypothetical protein